MSIDADNVWEMRQDGVVFDGEMGIPEGWPQDEPVVKALLSHA